MSPSTHKSSVGRSVATSTNPVINLVKLATLGVMGFGVIFGYGLQPVTQGENVHRDTIAVLAGNETSANCSSTGCIQPIIGITETFDLYNESGSFVIGEPANPLCELSHTGALQGRGCVITSGVSILGTVAGTITQTAGDARYVNTSGDTMTGALTINLTSGFLALNVRQMMSGATIHAEKTLASSGVLVINGLSTFRSTLSGSNLHAEKSVTASGSITTEGTLSGAVLIVRTASGNTVRANWYSPGKLGGIVIGSGSTVATGSGKTFFPVPKSLSGFLLFDAQMEVMVAGTTNVTSLQVRNLNQASCKMFTTVISIDSAETSSTTAATPFVVNGSCKSVGGGERLAIDVPGVSTTVPKVVTLILYFYKP